MQSAYKSGHSTETALLRVKNDIVMALEGKQCVLLVLLDLSAAFDTVDHEVLINRLSSKFGFRGQALAWFRSYLSNRSQCVTINNHQSADKELKFGVPQGSVLGPVLFTMYTSPLGEIIQKRGINYYLYADDTQLYLSFHPMDKTSTESTQSKLERCIHAKKLFCKTFSHGLVEKKRLHSAEFDCSS